MIRIQVQNLLGTQFGAVSAVAIRDIQSQQTNLMYGYAWVLVDVVLSVGGLIVMKTVIKAFNPPGMPPMTYILTGALPWYVFVHSQGLVAQCVKKHKVLLTLPGITQLDIIVGCALQTLITYGIMFVVMTTLSSYIEGMGPPRYFLGVALMFICCWLFGIFLGLVFLPLERLYEPAPKFIAFPLRFGLFLSGVFLLITAFPTYVWPYLTWNPMLHVIELMHTYWFYTYKTPVGNPYYVIQCLIGLAAAGLLLERYTRRRIPV